MQRRNVLGLGVTLAASAALGDKPVAKPTPAPAPTSPTPGGMPNLDGLKELDAFLASLDACADVGERCLVHCIEQLSTGNPMMADCARAVGTMVPACRALSAAALYGSPHGKALAGIVGRICRACEEACKKHAGHHVICGQCAEACGKCATACEKMAA